MGVFWTILSVTFLQLYLKMGLFNYKLLNENKRPLYSTVCNTCSTCNSANLFSAFKRSPRVSLNRLALWNIEKWRDCKGWSFIIHCYISPYEYLIGYLRLKPHNNTSPDLCKTQFFPPSLCSGSDHVSPFTLLSVFSSRTFWLMSFKYPSVPPFLHLSSSLSLCCLLFDSDFHPRPHTSSFALFPIYTRSFMPTIPLPLPPGLIISLQLLRGELEQIRRENQAVFNRALALTRKLGFPDVILPGKEAKSRGL